MTRAHRDETLKLERRDLNEDGFRVIAVAHKDYAGANNGLRRRGRKRPDADRLHRLPRSAQGERRRRRSPRSDAHGVQVKILTGDNEIVTRKICREVGLEVEGIVLGSDIEQHDRRRSRRSRSNTPPCSPSCRRRRRRAIIARAAPQRPCRRLPRRRHQRRPGAEGRRCRRFGRHAVDIAKESADIILLEKSLMVLERRRLEGRKVFGNITKYIKMGASSNFGNMFSVLGASASCRSCRWRRSRC